MENPTVCPHCDSQITSEDLANYPKKLREREIRKNFPNSEVYRKQNRIFIASLILGFSAVVYTIIAVVAPVTNLLNLSDGALLVLEIIFGTLTIIWTTYSISSLPRIENEYVASRMDEITASSK